MQEFRAQRKVHSNVDRLLTVRQVAHWLNVSTATVYALCGRGELAHLGIWDIFGRVSDRMQLEERLSALEGAAHEREKNGKARN